MFCSSRPAAAGPAAHFDRNESRYLVASYFKAVFVLTRCSAILENRSVFGRFFLVLPLRLCVRFSLGCGHAASALA
jgi:hypothetical protein